MGWWRRVSGLGRLSCRRRWSDPQSGSTFAGFPYTSPKRKRVRVFPGHMSPQRDRVRIFPCQSCEPEAQASACVFRSVIRARIASDCVYFPVSHTEPEAQASACVSLSVIRDRSASECVYFPVSHPSPKRDRVRSIGKKTIHSLALRAGNRSPFPASDPTDMINAGNQTPNN